MLARHQMPDVRFVPYTQSAALAGAHNQQGHQVPDQFAFPLVPPLSRRGSFSFALGGPLAVAHRRLQHS